MNRTVDGDVQQGVHTERDVGAATGDTTAKHEHAPDAESEDQEPLAPEAASHQVVVGDIPVEPPGFRPRAGLLAELDRAGARVSVIHAVTGLPGVGTTQLAAAYARAKLTAGWRLVAWVDGADTGSLQAGLAAVADATGLSDGDSGRGLADAGEAVRRWLETDGDRCLLVIDGVADPEVLRPFVPVGGTARVLITSTRQQTADLGNSIPVDVFSADEASAFLAGRTGLDDEAGAAQVAAVLGHLPLALALAAPLIAGQRVGYARFLDRLQAMPADESLTGGYGRPYPPGVARTVLLSLRAVPAADRTGVCTRVMEIMALLSAGGVRRELLYAAGQVGVLASGGRRVPAGMVDRVLEWLTERSLLTFSLDGQTVILDRLLARVIRNGLARRGRLTAVYEAAAFVLGVYSRALMGSPDRRAVRGIPQQVTALLEGTAGPAAEADEELAWVLLRLRFIAFYHLLELGDSTPQAIALGEPLSADLERLLGPDHPDTLTSRNSLAAAYLAAGRVAKAIPLFEQILAVRQGLLGSDDPDTLTSRNNLAAAYQDAGRADEAIQLYEQTLSIRERLLGADHPSTLNSRGNLATAYRDAGRAAEAIPLFEQVLADRERVLGTDHPDTQTSRRNLATAYRDAGRAAEAIPLFEQVLGGRNLATAYRHAGRVAEATPPSEQTSAAWESQPPADATGQVLPASFRRPPTDPARRELPAGFRRPPADPARRLLSNGVAGPSARRTDHPSSSRKQGPPLNDAHYDREVVAAIRAGDPAGITMAYDRYAAALYGYCRWVLRDTAVAAEALQDTFVIAAATLSDLSEPSKLRPWLYAVARRQCRRRLRPVSTARGEEADAANQWANAGQRADAVGQPAYEPIDVTMPIRAVSEPAYEPIDVTMPIRAVSEPAYEPIDVTMPIRAVSEPAYEPIDMTMPIRAVSGPAYEPIDMTMPMRAVSQPTGATGGLGHVNGNAGQAELRALVRSVLVDLKPREREVIELSFRHNLDDSDLAIALGVSWSRAHAQASRARGRLEKSFHALLATLTRRQACPVLGELLADWDGQLTERTLDLAGWHIEQCQTCAYHGRDALRPAALPGLLPLAPLPPGLREQVSSRCSSMTKNAVAYRRRVVRRAESTWFAIFAVFSQAIRRVSWDSIRANPGAAIATTAVAVWVVAAVSVTLLTFAGFHVGRAPETRPSSRTSASGPAAPAIAPVAPSTAPASASASPSLTSRPSPTYTPLLYVPSASPTVNAEPSPSASRSPAPSKSSTPPKSPSPPPSHSGSPSPPPSRTPSPSRTP